MASVGRRVGSGGMGAGKGRDGQNRPSVDRKRANRNRPAVDRKRGGRVEIALQSIGEGREGTERPRRAKKKGRRRASEGTERPKASERKGRGRGMGKITKTQNNNMKQEQKTPHSSQPPLHRHHPKKPKPTLTPANFTPAPAPSGRPSRCARCRARWG
ncbi:uncharacterized protein SCHCODRAFT_02065210 [Schizophyllum commune H4-8]|uniref:uncharacterized protein n=1 Tax=Schizophyllum commune (strain H4-8 / FGSC 9210) TaxID=578458 RepID=UPI00215F3586|nr:uncharacterized protein SCHCODRAFT_02065210 [Schizophyllum commune H4-8]KAI5887413.1 hypothetical protein SCHCODRAFT_02065210 [Schizophyllum commune H4-8]